MAESLLPVRPQTRTRLEKLCIDEQHLQNILHSLGNVPAEKVSQIDEAMVAAEQAIQDISPFIDEWISQPVTEFSEQAEVTEVTISVDVSDSVELSKPRIRLSPDDCLNDPELRQFVRQECSRLAKLGGFDLPENPQVKLRRGKLLVTPKAVVVKGGRLVATRNTKYAGVERHIRVLRTTKHPRVFTRELASMVLGMTVNETPFQFIVSAFKSFTGMNDSDARQIVSDWRAPLVRHGKVLKVAKVGKLSQVGAGGAFSSLKNLMHRPRVSAEPPVSPGKEK